MCISRPISRRCYQCLPSKHRMSLVSLSQRPGSAHSIGCCHGRSHGDLPWTDLPWFWISLWYLQLQPGPLAASNLYEALCRKNHRTSIMSTEALEAEVDLAKECHLLKQACKHSREKSSGTDSTTCMIASEWDEKFGPRSDRSCRGSSP